MNTRTGAVAFALSLALFAASASAVPPVSLSVTEAVRPIPLAPGGEVELWGAVRSSYDGAVIDAATNAGSDAEAPVAGGLYDLEAGGFRLISRDLRAHRYRLAATGAPGEGCVEAGVSSPCLVLRVIPLAHLRLMSTGEFARTLSGEVRMQVLDAPPLAPAPAEHKGALGAALAAIVAAAGLAWRARRARRPEVKVALAAERVATMLAAGEPVEQALVPSVRALGKKAHALARDGAARELTALATYVDSLEARLRDERSRRTADAVSAEVHALELELACALEAQAEVRAIG